MIPLRDGILFYANWLPTIRPYGAGFVSIKNCLPTIHRYAVG